MLSHRKAIPQPHTRLCLVPLTHPASRWFCSTSWLRSQLQSLPQKLAAKVRVDRCILPSLFLQFLFPGAKQCLHSHPGTGRDLWSWEGPAEASSPAGWAFHPARVSAFAGGKPGTPVPHGGSTCQKKPCSSYLPNWQNPIIAIKGICN